MASCRALVVTWLLVVGAFAVGCGARSALDLPDGLLGGGASGGSAGRGGSGGSGSGGGGGGHGSSNGFGADGGSTSGSGSSTSTSIGSGCVSDPGSAGPSCAAGGDGLSGCGACNETCCASFEVPAATYYRTYTNSGAGPTGQADLATVSSLMLDRYLVTVGRFRQFVTAWDGGAGYTPPLGSGIHTHLNGGQGLAVAGSPGMYETGWTTTDVGYLDPTDANLTQCAPASTWTASPGSAADESLPINCVNWWEAYAFCIWDGGFLPSDAEWELAAAAGDQQREYPWGSTDPGASNAYAIYGDGTSTCNFPMAETCIGAGNIAPVGTAAQGAGLYGQVDLAGNVGEWTLDWFAPYVEPCVDCAQLEFQSLKSIRGGSYEAAVNTLLPPSRAGRYPPGRTGDVGFRCARAP